LDEGIARVSAILEGTRPAARRLDAVQLDAALQDAHRRTASILADLDECHGANASGWQVPMLACINPPLWELGHVAWFAEWWILRDPKPVPGAQPMVPWVATRASLLDGADRWFDSARVDHDSRWSLALPSLPEVASYKREVLDRVRARLAREADDDEALYPYRLALFHEDMHGEALTGLRQTLDYAAPTTIDPVLPVVRGEDASMTVDAVRFERGAPVGTGFAFDNEQEAATVELAPFTIDAACVTHRAFREFVDAGGYRDPNLWPGDAGRWLGVHRIDRPARWRRCTDGDWQHRWFGTWKSLPLAAPVCHVNAFEAEAYCLWAGRRLPCESEWECAATRASADRFDWGRAVWEWTADAFLPYPGFVPGRYREYSAPWFGSHRAVRGASFATHERIRHPRYRNFYTPDRDDLFIGFRTCAR
jgi:ergothioneine biosynthesis protein EgtB